MSNFHNKQEKLLKDRVSRLYLRQLERLYGIEVKLLRSEKNAYSKVYGSEAGDESSDFKLLNVLITGDTFAPMDNKNAGLLTEGFLYTSQAKEVLVGDTVEVYRDDKRAYKFKVKAIDSVGVSESVISRFKIVAIGEGNLS